MSTRTDRYFAFLLRLWQSSHDNENIWHASLEDSRTGVKHGFASLEALMEYIQNLIKETVDGESTTELR